MEKLNRFFSRRKALGIGILAAVILAGLAVSGASAKYIQNVGNKEAIVRAKEFYFSSDLLAEHTPHHELNPGTKSITFQLRNHDDQLRFSEENVTYEINADNGATVTVLDGTIGQKLKGDQISNVTVRISGLTDGQEYTVTATGKSGYEKTLSATFKVLAQNEGAYKHLETDPSGAFILLTVWTENTEGDVTIDFPAGLIPDTTDPALAEIVNYDTESGESYLYQARNAAVGTLGTYSSHTYRFFLEKTSTEYDVNDFTVKVGTKEATPKIPD